MGRPEATGLEMTPADKPAPDRGSDDNIIDLTGWKRVVEYASFIIYAKGNKRRLVEQKTAKFTVEYKI